MLFLDAEIIPCAFVFSVTNTLILLSLLFLIHKPLKGIFNGMKLLLHLLCLEKIGKIGNWKKCVF